MTKKQIRVFPDYCSSGVWNEHGAEVGTEVLNIDKATSIALKYWHWIWETWDIDIPDLHETPVEKWWIEEVYGEWWNDGKAIVEAIAQQNPDIDVVYAADTPEEIVKLYYGD